MTPNNEDKQIAKVLERVEAKIDKTGDCWLWTGARTRKGEGYGQVFYDGRSRLAHRVYYTLIKGEIREGLELDHLCRNPPCVNPEHLEPVTHRTNILRGKNAVADNAKKTHCHMGHPLSGDNLYDLSIDGTRRCRMCNRRRSAKMYLKKKKALSEYYRTEEYRKKHREYMRKRQARLTQLKQSEGEE